MDSLRVNNGIKNIEVNDNGDYISIPVSDADFYERFGALVKNFEIKQAEIEQKAKEISEKHKGKLEDDADMIIDSINLYADLCRYTCSEMDKLFGDGCCSKVFVGIQNPGAELITDFLDQITPFIKKYAKERNQSINKKYNKNRKGAKS